MPDLRLVEGANEPEDPAQGANRKAASPDPVAAARHILREFEERFDVSDVPPVPVEQIAESLLDLLIEEADDVRSMPGAPRDRGRLSGMIDGDSSTIWLDRTECQRSRGRRRFTIAHECGHWVLHIAGVEHAICCRPQDVGDGPADRESKREIARQEAEANAFACELLMPELLVQAQARETGRNLSALAERFDVSVPAIRLRMLTLGLLPTWMATVPIVGGSR